MLRNRSRAVTSKQALMADHTPFPPTKTSTPISSFLGSPRFFNGFLSKKPFDSENAAMTPTSILDTKSSSSFVNPFAYDSNLPKLQIPSPEINSPNKLEPQAIGLALIDSLDEDEKDDGQFSKPINRMFLFGSKLKVQIPNVNNNNNNDDNNNPASSVSPVGSPSYPADFGIKTRNSQPLSPFPSTTAKNFARQLSLKEMELSEDYTCVIIHGPNPKTTHIFDDCIVESCSEDDEIKSDDGNKMEYGFESPNTPNSPPVDFLSYCHNCKDSLEQGKDIYMYRGEKAFCSEECRGQEMLFELKNSKRDDDF